ncbi:MAG: HAD family hydrolase [Acidobacteriota bacterium]
MKPKVRRLILFDVDGTLISTAGRAGKALTSALLATYGTAGPFERYRYSGKTDPQIVFELLQMAGLQRTEIAPKLVTALERYVVNLETALQPGTVQVLPGARELLADLAARPEIRIGLLTGNIAPGAEIKLKAAGLLGWFEIGAYGSDSENRDALVPVARERALARWGDDFAGTRTVVVGDAPADIRCARAGGARAVAVASGWTPREHLAALAPDAILDDLLLPRSLAALLDGGK